jgi:hypothetical protein
MSLETSLSFPVDRGERTDDRGQTTEDGPQMTEDGWQRTDDGSQITDGRGQATDDRGRKREHHFSGSFIILPSILPISLHIPSSL